MRILLLNFFLLLLFQSSAQNLVPNPSFEDYSWCPFDFGQINQVIDWYNDSPDDNNPGLCLETPDYFNACDTIGGWGFGLYGIPDNDFGYQYPYSGNGYVGIVTIHPSGCPNFREYVGVELTTPLTIGQQYYVSFYAALSLDYFNLNYASNNIGARFSTVPLINAGSAPFDNYAHVNSINVITDTLNWTKISGYFIADSAYNRITIGNFFTDSATTTVLMDTTAAWPYAYYYIDDVCVSTDSLTCSSSVGINEFTYPKKLIRIVDLMGRETEDKPNTLLIYIYSDGTTEKVFRVE